MTPDSDTTTPRTADDLRAIARFIRDRVAEEHQAVGGLDYYLEKGVTIQARIPRNFSGYRDTAEEYTGNWLNTHTPKDYLQMASALCDLADELARALTSALGRPGGNHLVDVTWSSLLRAAKLWRNHPDFQVGWEPATNRGED